MLCVAVEWHEQTSVRFVVRPSWRAAPGASSANLSASARDQHALHARNTGTVLFKLKWEKHTAVPTERETPGGEAQWREYAFPHVRNESGTERDRAR